MDSRWALKLAAELLRCMLRTARSTPGLAPQRNGHQQRYVPLLRHPHHAGAPPMAAPEPESSHWPVGSGDSERTALVCPMYCTASVTGKGCRSLGLGSLGTSTSGSAERGVPHGYTKVKPTLVHGSRH